MATLAVAPGFAQENPAKSSPFKSILGEVTAVDADAKQISLKTDAGQSSTVPFDAKTHFVRLAPGEKDLKKATEIALTDIGVGDRILARTRNTEDATPATLVVNMSKQDLTRHQEKNQAEWQARGLTGTVTVINPATREITLKLSGRDQKTVVIEPADSISIRKYAPASVKFSDAKPSSFAEMHVGDTVRVLGTKNEDGTRVKPEEIVFGSFLHRAGTIVSIDAAAGTLRINDLETKKPVVVAVNPSTTLKRIPPQMAAMMARMQNGGAATTGPGGGPGRGMGGPTGAQNAGPGAGVPGPGNPGAGRMAGPGAEGTPQAGAGGPGGPAGPGGGMRGGMDPQRMMERFPAITLADLKAGDAVMVSGSAGADPSTLTAISLVAGVEPLLTAPTKGGQQQAPGGAWNFEMSIPQ